MSDLKALSQAVELSGNRMKYKPRTGIVCHPFFLNDKRTRIGAIVRDPMDPQNSRWVEDERESNSPFIYDVFSQWDESVLEENTRREMQIIATNRVAMQQEEEEQRKRQEQDELFRMKVALFDQLQTKELRRMARKATSVERLRAIATAGVLKELEEQDEPEDGV